MNIVPDEFFEGPSREHVYGLTKTLVAEFERVACIVFDNRDELERALFVHLNTSLYRYQYGIQIGNLLGDDIMHEYPELFAITKITAKHLEEDFGVPLPDSEVAYLAMHFGGFLKISGQENNRLRILIVCTGYHELCLASSSGETGLFSSAFPNLEGPFCVPARGNANAILVKYCTKVARCPLKRQVFIRKIIITGYPLVVFCFKHYAFRRQRMTNSLSQHG
ncbi:MAG: PRD domain-containing protein [Clostridiales bacterium]|nr:PRD domain-containing protein [Clostridiales bacterium]